MVGVHHPHAVECPGGRRGERILQSSIELGGAENGRFAQGHWEENVRGESMGGCDCRAHR